MMMNEMRYYSIIAIVCVFACSSCASPSRDNQNSESNQRDSTGASVPDNGRQESLEAQFVSLKEAVVTLHSTVDSLQQKINDVTETKDSSSDQVTRLHSALRALCAVTLLELILILLLGLFGGIKLRSIIIENKDLNNEVEKAGKKAKGLSDDTKSRAEVNPRDVELMGKKLSDLESRIKKIEGNGPVVANPGPIVNPRGCQYLGDPKGPDGQGRYYFNDISPDLTARSRLKVRTNGSQGSFILIDVDRIRSFDFPSDVVETSGGVTLSDAKGAEVISEGRVYLENGRWYVESPLKLELH